MELKNKTLERVAALSVKVHAINAAGAITEREEEAERAVIGQIEIFTASGGQFFESCYPESESLEAIDGILEALGQLNVSSVYVYDGSIFFPFLDTYAAKMGFKNAAELKADSNGKRIIEEAYDIRGGGAGEFYTRKIWVRLRGRRATGGNGHKRLKAISFYALRPLMPQYSTLEAAAAAFNVCEQGYTEAQRIFKILNKFTYIYQYISGDIFFDKKPAGITIGGLSKKIYLNCKYPTEKNALKAYQRDYKRTEEDDLYLRERGLMLGGLLYAKNFNEVYEAKGKPFYKYDVNSLFPYITATAPALGKLVKCENFDTNNIDCEKYVYIYVFKHLILKRKDNMPAVFANPFEELPKSAKSKKFEKITIDREYAIFDELFAELLNFYNVIDGELLFAYQIRKCKDPAATNFVKNLYNIKSKDTGAMRTTAKLLLNNLHGKFAQTTLTARKQCVLKDDIPKYIESEFEDNFAIKHFDFVRGAYIYTLSRVIIMRDIREKVLKGGYDYLYSDTDSIITNCPPEVFGDISPNLGDYKTEGIYSSFCAIKWKTYVCHNVMAERGRTHIIEITAAGLPKKTIEKEANELYAGDFEKFINAFKKHEITTKILKRLKNGVAFVNITRTLTDVEKNVTFDEHIEEE